MIRKVPFLRIGNVVEIRLYKATIRAKLFAWIFGFSIVWYELDDAVLGNQYSLLIKECEGDAV